MIDKREKTRVFIAETYKELSDKPSMTLEEYTKKCNNVLREIIKCFPSEATARKKYYQNIMKKLRKGLGEYRETVEDTSETLPIDNLAKMTDVNIKKLLTELNLNYSNDVKLYKLKQDLMKVFNESRLLQELGISVAEDRIKSKKTENGYRSEFVGLNLVIMAEEYTPITLPIECQIQTMEQYRDGNIGFSAHTKMPMKGIKLKSIPKNRKNTKYNDPQGKLNYYREFLSHIMHISPQCSIARTTGNDFEEGRVIITPYDLYEAFRLISRVPKEDIVAYRTYQSYLGELYERRDDLFPSGDVLLPQYMRKVDIPNSDNGTHNPFFKELATSLKKTFSDAFGKNIKNQTIKEKDMTLEHNEH